MRRFRPVCVTCLLCAALCARTAPIADQQSAVPQTLPGLNSLQGTRVASVEITGPAIDHPELLRPLLLQKANEPLDKYKVRQSVQALFNTGRFADIRVEASRNSSGDLDLVFATRENYFFGSIRAEGLTARPSDTQIVNAARLSLGDQFTDDKIKAAIEGIQRTLREGGYYRAVVQPFYEWDAPAQQVKVLFRVTRGQAARVGQITATGTSDYTPEQVSNIAKLHTGQRVSEGLARRATDRLRKRLQKKGLLEAQVTLTERAYHPESNTLDYTFEIVPGPVVDVKVEGAKLSRSTVKRLVPVFEENTVDEDLLNEGARNIQDFLQTQGYFDAKVSFTQRGTGNERRDVVYRVQKNARHKLASLVIEGNKYFRLEDIRDRLQMQTAGGFSRHGLFSQALLTRDIATIEDLYRANGFQAVKVDSHVVDNYRGQEGRLQVVLSIEEGPQTTVGEVSVTGNQAISTADILKLVSAQPGQPYATATVVNDQTEVLNAYFDRGFPDARFTYSTKAQEGTNKIDIFYEISEGRQVFVNRVLIAGLHYTRPFVVNHEMKVRSGQPLSQRAMLDSQGNLYNLGLFNEVDVAVQNPDGAINQKNVNFQLTEAKRYTFNYGGGLEIQTGQAAGPTNPQGATGVSPRVSFGVTRINFRGRDQTASLKLRYGNLEKLALIGFTEPRLFDNPKLTVDFTAFYQQTNDVSTFTATRAEGSVQLRQTLSRSTTLLYRMIYRRVDTSNLVINPAEVPLFSQPVRIGMPAFSYIRNTRDNDLDSHKGSFTASDIGVASSAFGSQTNFVRWIGQNSTYYQFGRKRWVFARNTRVGIEEPFAGTSAAVVAPGPGAPPPQSFIPLPERFFAGGATSLRGFGVNQAGPRDLATGLPLGGEALFINNLELRTPPVPVPFLSYVGNNLSLVLFNDIGNAFTTPNAMFTSLYRFTQPNRDTCLNPAVPNCNFNYMSFAMGSGIRYRTPIGPVSFDVAYNFNPPAFPVSFPIQPVPPTNCASTFVPGSSLPSAQCVPPFSSVLRHFNFFFNIGQTF